jgi:hypothetical protein
VRFQQDESGGIPFGHGAEECHAAPAALRWKRGTQMIPGDAKTKTTQWIEIELGVGNFSAKSGEPLITKKSRFWATLL